MPYDVNHIGAQLLNSVDGQVKIDQIVCGLLTVKMKDIF